jgi:hypothetical protein
VWVLVEMLQQLRCAPGGFQQVVGIQDHTRVNGVWHWLHAHKHLKNAILDGCIILEQLPASTKEMHMNKLWVAVHPHNS